MVEVSLPWRYDMFESPKAPPGLGELYAGFYERGIYPPTIAFAPDDAYSVPGMTGVIDFVCPDGPLTGYDRREYLIATDALASIYPALIESPGSAALEAFALPDDGTRDLFVCTHAAIDACCATYGYPIYKLLRHMVDALDTPTRAWRCTHFGGHRFAGTLLDMPTGRYWGHLSARELGPLLKQDRDAESLRRHYRGWAALPYGAAQVAEGELFRRAGWRWLECAATPAPTPEFDWDTRRVDEQTVGFEVRHVGLGVSGTVTVEITHAGTIRTKDTSKGEDWHDAQQYHTRIVACEGLEGLFGEG